MGLLKRIFDIRLILVFLTALNLYVLWVVQSPSSTIDPNILGVQSANTIFYFAEDSSGAADDNSKLWANFTFNHLEDTGMRYAEDYMMGMGGDDTSTSPPQEKVRPTLLRNAGGGKAVRDDRMVEPSVQIDDVVQEDDDLSIIPDISLNDYSKDGVVGVGSVVNKLESGAPIHNKNKFPIASGENSNREDDRGVDDNGNGDDDDDDEGEDDEGGDENGDEQKFTDDGGGSEGVDNDDTLPANSVSPPSTVGAAIDKLDVISKSDVKTNVVSVVESEGVVGAPKPSSTVTPDEAKIGAVVASTVPSSPDTPPTSPASTPVNPEQKTLTTSSTTPYRGSKGSVPYAAPQQAGLDVVATAAGLRGTPPRGPEHGMIMSQGRVVPFYNYPQHSVMTENFKGKFSVGDRKDYVGTVTDVLMGLGMVRSRSRGFDFDVYWGYQWSTDNMRDTYLNPELGKTHPLVNSVPGMEQLLGLKPSLARAHKECISKLSRSQCKFTFISFNFERKSRIVKFEKGSVKSWRTFQDQLAPEGLWILKPKYLFSNRGIELVKLKRDDVMKQSKFAKWVGNKIPVGDWTVQKYLDTPLLYDGRKFDMRAWVLITSLNPLRVYIMDKALPKISTRKFSTSRATLKDKCMHIAMPVGEGCELKDQVYPYPKSSLDPWFEDNLGFKPGMKPLSWSNELWPRVQQTMMKAILMVRSECLEYDDQIRAANLLYRRVLFMSPDVILDNEGQAYLEEMNTNGFMVGDSYPMFWRTVTDIGDAFRLLGLGGWSRREEYQAEFFDQLEGFCAARKGNVGCSFEERRELQLLVDEEEHAVGWSRIFPIREVPSRQQSLEKFFFRPPTAMDQLTWDFIDYRNRMKALAAAKRARDEEQQQQQAIIDAAEAAGAVV